MNPIVQNILAVIGGIIGGGVVNMGLLIIGSFLIPVPEGINAWDPESLANGMSKLQAYHFITPFLAHALGTLAGSFIVAKFTTTKHLVFALFIGAFFILGGIINVINLPAPLWFEALDLVAAYFPMAFLGWKLSGQN